MGPSTTTMESPSAESFKELENALFNGKDLLNALEAYSKGIRQDPRNYILFPIDRGNAALEDFEAALAGETFLSRSCFCPRQSIYITPYNRLFTGSARSSHCTIDADRCIDLEPTFVKGYFRKASAELQLRKFDAAETTIKRAMKLESASSAECKAGFSRMLRSVEAHRKNEAEAGAEALPTPPRKKLTEFELGEEIGVGNFTRIMVAKHKATTKYML